MGKAKNKTVKNELVFDTKKREEFLKGFSKRKKQRQQKAIQQVEEKLKEERQRIKLESKNLKDKFKQSFKQIDELKDIVSDDEEDIDGVTIKISGLDNEVSEKFIGLRKVEESSESEAEQDNDVHGNEKIAGMSIEEEAAVREVELKTERSGSFSNLKTEKDFKKMIKKQTKSAMKKSKAVQMKNNLNHKRNVKLASRKKHFKEKFLKKHKKIPKHYNRNNKT